MKACITANAEAALTLLTSISSLEALADEIKINMRTNAQIIQKLGSNDKVDQIAVLNTGNSAKSKLQTSNKRNLKH